MVDTVGYKLSKDEIWKLAKGRKILMDGVTFRPEGWLSDRMQNMINHGVDVKYDVYLKRDDYCGGFEYVLREKQMKKSENNDIRKNGSGVEDPTAYEAIKNLEDDAARMHKLVDAIRNICSLSGFYIEGRITLKSKKTGKIYY